MSRPQLLDSALYALLHKDDIAGFNQERPQGPIDMRGGDFRGLDLRQLNAQDVDFTDSYFRSADLRGWTCVQPVSRVRVWPMRRFQGPTSRLN